MVKTTKKTIKKTKIKSPSKKEHIFITGFPGFIGSRLVDRLLHEFTNPDFYLIVQDNFYETAQGVIEKIKSNNIKCKSKFNIIKGDISTYMLDFNSEDYKRLTKKVTRVYHLAAIYNLSVSSQVAYKINVEGTSNILEFCEDCKKLKQHCYISTCYVAGDRAGVIYEDELESGQDFKNHYEETKYLAEVLVKNSMSRIPTVVVRPGIVVGDSDTGETNKYDGPYYVMKILQMLPPFVPMINIGEMTAKVNVVPVDYVVNAITKLSVLPNTIGQTFQLAETQPLSSMEIADMACSIFKVPKVNFTVPLVAVDIMNKTKIVDKLLGIPDEFFEYFNYDAYFDSTNTRKYLEPEGIYCPKFKNYLPTLVNYFVRHPNISLAPKTY